DGLTAHLVEDLRLVWRTDDADWDATTIQDVLRGVCANAACCSPDQDDVTLLHVCAVRRHEHAITGGVAQRIHCGLFPRQVLGLRHQLVGLDDGEVSEPAEVRLVSPDALVAAEHRVVVRRRVLVVLNGGGIPVGVVSSPDKAKILHEMGCEAVIDRSAAGYKFWNDDNTHNEAEWRRFGGDIRALVGEDPDIVFEHPGRSTFGASMYVVKKGGTVVTCAATSGYMLEFDNRYFWMRLKNLVGSHFANYREAWEANRLISKGMIHPVLSQVFDLADTGEAAYQVHKNMHEGKIGVLCLAPKEGMGVTNPELRAKVGEKNLTLFRRK
ncbi:MAG: hypothetical protein EBZ00_03720, partial [Actinobacteria bacterium]|nr:hypothetical protein [Actinomycetota bacterium]